MIHSPLEKPEPVTVKCHICGMELTAKFFWFGPPINRWVRPSVHVACVEALDKTSAPQAKAVEQPIPERFAHFEASKANGSALDACAAFSPDSPLHTLALTGAPATGKSRLMWETIRGFFHQLQVRTGARRWVEYYIFAELVTEPERSLINDIKAARYVFIDDIGSTECYGRDKARLQNLIRFRVQKNLWTFLTIDDPEFDEGFRDLFRDRAVEVFIDD